MSNVYLDNKRILKLKDVDKYLNKICSWPENISLKIWLFGACCLIGGVTFLLVSDVREFKKSSKTQTNQKTEVKTPDNPVKTILYNATSNHTR